MKFLWSNSASDSPSKTEIGYNTIAINNGRALEFLDSNGHSTHFRIENATGKYAAISSFGKYLACAELGKVAALHLVDVHTNTSSGRVNSIETIETFTLNNPNIEILDVSLNSDLLLAVLFEDRVIIFQGKNPNGLIIESMIGDIPVNNPKRIMFDKSKKDLLYIWSDTSLSVLKLDILKKSTDFEWQLASQNINYKICDETGELKVKTVEKYLKEFSLSQDDFESNNSQLLVEKAISQLDMIDGIQEPLDKISQISSYNENYLFVVTENSNLYLIGTKNNQVIDVLKNIKLKQKKFAGKCNSDWVTAVTNFKPVDCRLDGYDLCSILTSKILQIRKTLDHPSTICIDFEYDGIIVELSHFQVSPENSTVSAQIDIQKSGQGKSVKALGRFRFLDDGSITVTLKPSLKGELESEAVVTSQPAVFNNTQSIWISLSPSVTWIASLSSNQYSVDFYDAEKGDYLFSHGFEYRISKIYSCSSILLIGTVCGTGVVLNIEGVNQIVKCASYKLYHSNLDLITANENKIIFGSSSSNKAFSFDTESQNFQKVLNTKNIANQELYFSYFQLIGETVFYSARPASFHNQHSCILGRITNKDQSQILTDKAFKSDFNISSGQIKLKSKYSICTIAVSQLIESRKVNQKIKTERVGKQCLPYMQILDDKVLEPDNDFIWVSPCEAETGTFVVQSCGSHVSISAGESIVVYSESNGNKFSPIKIKKSGIEVKMLLEEHLVNQERENLEEKYHSERNVIQSRLDLLVKELKAAKDENHNLPDIEKIDSSEIVLNKAVIQQREEERILMAERLEHELKMRIAIAKAREELIDKYCDVSLKTRDGSIRYLNKSNPASGKFYEIRLDTEQNQILEETESIRHVWKNKIIEELRVQASARTDQQNAELDEAEAAGGESTDDMMQRLATRGIGIGADKDLFLPQLWLLDDESRSDQEKLMILAAAAIRDHFNAKAKKLFDRKKAELNQHNDRVQ